MPFDFNKPIDRHGTYSMKWDVANQELPMWVADMDFETAPPVIEAICQKARRGIFGYTIVPDIYLEAVCNWWNRRYNFTIDKSWILYSTGVIPAISSIVRKITTVGENIVIQPPVYNIFYNCILNNGRHVLENKLIYRSGKYDIDFEDLECKLADPQTTLMILCNPHNPIGKVWNHETLLQIGYLCEKYNVVLLSDEIHCDITRPGLKYTPFASVSELCAQNSITCLSPTKAFNLAGLQTASVVVKNPVLRQKVNRALNTDEVAEPNAFAIEATIAAFSNGESWLDALNTYIQTNKDTVVTYIQKNTPIIKTVSSDATYLLWLDCSAIAKDSKRLCDFIHQHTGLYLSAGNEYGEKEYCFLRMNIATSHSRLLDGLQRLKHGVAMYQAHCNHF